MALFRSKRDSSRIFGSEVAGYLAVYGAHDFDSGSHPVPGTDVSMWLGRMMCIPSEDGARAAAELSEFARDRGGWTAVGASAAIRGFLPNEVTSETAISAEDERIRFLHEQGADPRHLSFNDQEAWRRVFG